MLDKLRLNDSRITSPGEIKPSVSPMSQPNSASNARKISSKREVDVKTESDTSSAREYDGLSGSELYTPATEAFDESVKATNAEMERVKKELEAARSVIDQQKRELEETRNFKHTMEQALPSPSEADFPRNDHQIAAMHR